jgi:uncharacterized protein with NRDE domain
MCLILIAWQAREDYSMVVAANRDEFHVRPTSGAGFWSDIPQILAGRDLEAMGTWLGVTRGGRFAAVTNVRVPLDAGTGSRSRGLLAREFLESDEAAVAYALRVEEQASAYRAFNLLLGDGRELWWLSNRASSPRRLEPGIYGLSNDVLDAPWPKVIRGKAHLGRIMSAAPAIEPLLELLDDTSVPTDDQLPDTGVGIERERLLAAARIVSPEYGTRCSSALVLGRDGRLQFAERAFDARGAQTETLRYDLRLAA